MKIPLGQYLELLHGYLLPQKRRVAVLFVCVLLSIALQVANPQIIAAFIDDALAGDSNSRLLTLAAVFIAVAFAGQLTSVATTYFSETIGWTATNALRADLALHCLRLDMTFHKTRTPGEMIQRIDGDVDGLSNFFSQFVIYLLGNVLLVGGVLFFLFLEDWRIGLTLTLFSLAALGVLSSLRSFAVHHWLALREQTARFYGFLGEQLTGTEDIRGNGGRSYSMRRFHEHLRDWRPPAIRSGMAFAWMWMATLSVFTIGSAVAMVISFFLWERGSLSVGAVYLVFHYTELLRRPSEHIREQIQELQAATASITRVQELFRFQSKTPDEGETLLPGGALSLVLHDVNFAYDDGELVLKRVTLDLAPGEVLGLLGRTGSGKTTIGRLLVRLYDVSDGELELAGVPVRDLPLQHLRSRIAVVTQDVQLFEGRVRDNLTLFDPSISDERLTSALETLGLGDWLASLPQGLDTLIQGGSGLSAGEAQLLACARAFLADPGVVLMDEATSRLDPATQRLIDSAMDQLLAGRTAIIVAHRLATVDRADSIAIVEDGEIVEQGPREMLLADPDSRFSKLRHMDVESITA